MLSALPTPASGLATPALSGVETMPGAQVPQGFAALLALGAGGIAQGEADGAPTQAASPVPAMRQVGGKILPAGLPPMLPGARPNALPGALAEMTPELLPEALPDTAPQTPPNPEGKDPEGPAPASTALAPAAPAIPGLMPPAPAPAAMPVVRDEPPAARTAPAMPPPPAPALPAEPVPATMPPVAQRVVEPLATPPGEAFAAELQPVIALREAQPAPAPATGAPPAAPSPQAAPHDFATLVDRLMEARDAIAPQAVRAAIAHAEFGQVSLRFQPDDHALSVTMASADPGFAPAVQAAVSAAQAASDSDRDAPRQDGQAAPQQSAGHAPSGQGSGQGQAPSGQGAERGNPRAAPADPRRQDGEAPEPATPEPSARGGIYA